MIIFKNVILTEEMFGVPAGTKGKIIKHEPQAVYGDALPMLEMYWIETKHDGEIHPYWDTQFKQELF